MTAVICSRTADLLRKCVASVRATSEGAVRRIVVVAHEENGDDRNLRAVAATYGALVVPFSGAFNFARMCNMGAATVDTPAVLFLNDDVEATRPGWARRLAECLTFPETGIAGATLRYPDGTLQHAGIVAGAGDGVAHVGRGTTGSPLWPWLPMTRDVSAVTGACLAIRTNVFQELGGFDADFCNNYNDVDLCFRARRRGYQVVCAAVEGLVHAECQTRPGVVRFDERYRFYKRWEVVLSQADPYYSVSLAPTERIVLNLSGDAGFRRLLCGEG